MKKLIIFIFLITIFGNVEAIERFYLPVQDGTVVSLSRKIAHSHLGLSETNNRGWHIKLYGKAVYGKPVDGFYYCYAFQYWAVDSACKILNIKNNMPQTGHCLTALNIAKKKYEYEKFTAPKVDDIIIWATSQGNGHAGRTDTILDLKKWIVGTSEANTSSDNSNTRNGGMVTKKKRYLKLPLNRMKLKGVINFKVVKNNKG